MKKYYFKLLPAAALCLALSGCTKAPDDESGILPEIVSLKEIGADVNNEGSNSNKVNDNSQAGGSKTTNDNTAKEDGGNNQNSTSSEADAPFELLNDATETPAGGGLCGYPTAEPAAEPTAGGEDNLPPWAKPPAP